MCRVSLLLANAWSCPRKSMSIHFAIISGTEIGHPEYDLPRIV